MEIKLNDILHLSDEEIKNSKIGLNMGWEEESFFRRWYESDEKQRDVGFTYHSHQGEKKNGRNPNRNFTKVGQKCFGFVRLPENPNHWLLISAGVITSIPDVDHIGACGHEEMPKYQGLLGRLVIKYNKGNTFSRYIFNLKNIIDKIEVLEILPNIYEPIKFSGLENVRLDFKTLKIILEGTKYSDYRAALKGVKGIYCLTDKKTGKLYIGSAYGKEGILQRWEEYKKSMHGGNVDLIKLLKDNNEKYFEDNFQYSLLETFSKNTPDNKVIERETYWKDVFQTRGEFGYNRN